MSEPLATFLTFVRLLASVRHLVVFACIRLGKAALAVTAGVVPRSLMHRAHMHLEIPRAVAHLGAEAAGPSALQCVVVDVYLQLIPCRLAHATVGTDEVLDACMAQ